MPVLLVSQPLLALLASPALRDRTTATSLSKAHHRGNNAFIVYSKTYEQACNRLQVEERAKGALGAARAGGTLLERMARQQREEEMFYSEELEALCAAVSRSHDRRATARSTSGLLRSL